MSWLLQPLITGIGSSVVEYLKEHEKTKLHEQMQAEVLEGWMFKVEKAIETEHRKQKVSYAKHLEVIAVVRKVVDEEFNTEKI